MKGQWKLSRFFHYQGRYRGYRVTRVEPHQNYLKYRTTRTYVFVYDDDECFPKTFPSKPILLYRLPKLLNNEVLLLPHP